MAALGARVVDAHEPFPQKGRCRDLKVDALVFVSRRQSPERCRARRMAGEIGQEAQFQL